MAHLVANLLSNRIVVPERLVATTFTNKGAGELKGRIQKYAPLDLLNRTHIGTFHALALRRMQTLEPKRWPMNRNIDLPGKSREGDVPHAAVLWKAILQYGSIPGSKKTSLKLVSTDEATRNYSTAVGLLRARGITDPGDPHVAAMKLDDLSLAYAAFNEAKLKGKFWDFGDVLAAYAAFVKSGPPLADVVIVDEAQDQSQVQLEIASALGKNIVLVGDGAQAIFQWAGAYPAIFLEADKKLGAKTSHLSYNFRSVPEIVDLGNRIVKNYSWSLDHAMLPVHPSKGTALRVRRAGQKADEEAHWIAEDVKHLLSGSGAPKPGEVTILTRTNSHLFDIQAELTLRDIPTVVMGSSGLFDSREAMDVLCYLTLARADSPAAMGALDHVLDRPKRFLGKAAAGRIREELGKVGSIRHALRNTCATPEARKLSMLLDQLRRASWTQAIELVETLLVDGGKERRENKGDPDEDAPGIYKALCSIAKKFPGPREFIEFTEKCARGGTTDDPSDPTKVVLSTIHKYKGRENTHIYAPGTEQVLPHGKATNSDRNQMRGPDVEGELRLFYVACTRAKEKLTLTYWGSELENRGVSRFVREFCRDALSDPLSGYMQRTVAPLLQTGVPGDFDEEADDHDDDHDDDPALGGTGLSASLPPQRFLGGWGDPIDSALEALSGINPNGLLK